MSQEPRRPSARESARLRHQAEVARARRRLTLLVSAIAVAVLALVVGIGVAVQSHRSAGATASSAVPAHLTDGGVLVGSAGAPVTVTVYEDFQCPICRAFEQSSGPVLDQLRQAGTVQVIERPVAILDRASSTDYSTRALSAAGCVVDAAPQAYPAFAHELFARQPPENGAGLSDRVLGDVAQQAGAGDVRTCIADNRFHGWAGRATEQASRDGLTGTPYVLVDGRPLADPSPAGLQAAVAAARR